MHRYHARRAARTELPLGFVTPPDPRTIGVVARGRQLITGNFLFSGLFIEGPQLSIWDIVQKNPQVRGEIHGCAWMDDLAAVGDEKARDRAQTWVFDWIKRFGDGRSDGWVPEVTGRRLIRWINHGSFVLRGQDQTASDDFMRTLAQQTLFLHHRWKTAPKGLPQLEALSGVIYAGLTLQGMDKCAGPAVIALAALCETHISPGGAIATRNPEELLETLTLLNLVHQTLTNANQRVPRQVTQAIERIAPTLRGLRHADGALPRFHGGGAGLDGWLDQALADSGVRTPAPAGLQMGFARLTGGRSTIIVDAAPPPTGAASAKGHASTLGFELTSGRRPLIVNCGSGARFGKEWRRASRATPSHSTLCFDGMSSSRLNSEDDLLSNTPDVVRYHAPAVEGGRKLEVSHNGYQASHGLTHARILQLSTDGRTLWGEDLLTTLDDADTAVFDSATADQGVAFSIRFHLHPDVTTTTHGPDVYLTLKSGETWVFRHDGSAGMALSPSVYLQNGRLRPLGTHQVVLSGRAMSYATRVRWSLAKAQDTPTALRDLVQTAPLDDVDYTPGDFE